MINPLKFYSITELLELAKEGFFPITNRSTIIDLIHNGQLKARDFGPNGRPMFKIKGDEILAFFETGTIPKKVIQNKNVKRTPRTKKAKDEKSLPEVKDKVHEEGNEDRSP